MRQQDAELAELGDPVKAVKPKKAAPRKRATAKTATAKPTTTRKAAPKRATVKKEQGPKVDEPVNIVFTPDDNQEASD